MPKVFPSQVVDYINNYQHKIEINTNRSIPVNHDDAIYLSALLKLLKEIPHELLKISGDDYTDLVLATESINYSLKRLSSDGFSAIGLIEGKNVLNIIRDILEKCSDTLIKEETNELSFVDDDFLRQSIREDISGANSAFHNGEWKASVVLAGSACEALLLWALTIKGKKYEADEKLLHKFIKDAKNHKIIKKDTSDIIYKVKESRNLVHPDKAQREKQLCNRGMSLLGLSGIEMLVNDLCNISS